MHLCHAHFAREHGSEGSYEPIMDALNKINVGTVSLEYATPVSFGVGSLARFGDKARLYALHQHASASRTLMLLLLLLVVAAQGLWLHRPHGQPRRVAGRGRREGRGGHGAREQRL